MILSDVCFFIRVYEIFQQVSMWLLIGLSVSGFTARRTRERGGIYIRGGGGGVFRVFGLGAVALT